MELTLTEAAAQLGKTPRQVRYLIKKGQLQARKRGGVWIIESSALSGSDTRSDAQVEAGVRKQQQLRATVEEALDLDEPRRKKRYSFKQLRATKIAIPLYHELVASLGAEHPAARSLHDVVEHLA